MNARPEPEKVLDDDEDPALIFTKRPATPKRKKETPPAPAVPKYLSMIRTEARLRSDQVDELSTLRRTVARNRQDKTERITDNTLIRIAVDLLLQHTDKLVGNTEAELRAAILTALPGESTTNKRTRKSGTP